MLRTIIFSGLIFISWIAKGQIVDDSTELVYNPETTLILLEEDIKNILLSFKSTFENIIKDNRHLVKNLRDYKAYDFRLGSAYLAMMSAFHETEESRKFYSRLVQDKKDDKTSIGRYNKKLKLSQENINFVKKEMEKHSEILDVKKVLVKIEKEILSRD